MWMCVKVQYSKTYCFFSLGLSAMNSYICAKSIKVLLLTSRNVRPPIATANRRVNSCVVGTQYHRPLVLCNIMIDEHIINGKTTLL